MWLMQPLAQAQSFLLLQPPPLSKLWLEESALKQAIDVAEQDKPSTEAKTLSVHLECQQKLLQSYVRL